MNQFCNKKRKREENENEDIFAIPDKNKKLKKIEFSFPQEVSELSDFTSNDSHLDKNISFNNIEDINSNSSLLSKNDQINSNTNNAFLFKVKKYKEKEVNIKNFKKIELQFEEIAEEQNPIIKSKSFALEINIKRELLSYYSIYSNSCYQDSSSHYSNSTSQDLYYPYEIGELIENQYLVSNCIFNIFIF